LVDATLEVTPVRRDRAFDLRGRHIVEGDAKSVQARLLRDLRPHRPGSDHRQPLDAVPAKVGARRLEIRHQLRRSFSHASLSRETGSIPSAAMNPSVVAPSLTNLAGHQTRPSASTASPVISNRSPDSTNIRVSNDRPGPARNR